MLPEELSRLAGTWGLIYMAAIFAVAVAYALWPSNRAKFERAARLPLEEPAAPRAAIFNEGGSAAAAPPSAGDRR